MTKKRRKPSAAHLAKRKELIALSKVAQMMVKEGMADSVNQALLDMYSDGDVIEFNTFHQWKDQGMNIIKGSTAFLVWGKPKKTALAEPNPDKPEEDSYRFWPICYLFSENQVEKATVTA